MKAKLQKYWIIFYKSFKDSTFYPFKVLTNLFVMIFRFVLLFGIYGVVYSRLNLATINGLTYQAAVWSLGLYFIFLAIPTRRIGKVMGKDIRSGNVELKINKPVNYVLFKVSEFCGQILLDSFVVTLVAFPMIYFYVGLPNINYNLAWFLGVILLTIFGLALSFLININIGILAFWLEDITPVYWIIDKGLMILGGSYIPVALFPQLLRVLAEILPFGAPVFVNQLFYPDFATNMYKLILVQFIWVVFFALSAYKMYQKAILHLSINGG